jgi:hypothetical protein
MFINCVQKDYDNLLIKPENQKFVQYNIPKIACPNSIDTLYMIGFVVQIHDEILSKRLKFENESFIVTQLRVGNLTIRPMSICVGREYFKSKKDIGYPTILFDECIQMENQIYNIRKYKLVRRVLRFAGLRAKFIGTSANISNFVTRDVHSESRSGELRPWCYIVHKLSPVAKSYLDRKKKILYLKC